MVKGCGSSLYRSVLMVNVGWCMSYVLVDITYWGRWHGCIVGMCEFPGQGGSAVGRYGIPLHVTAAATSASSTKCKGSSSQLAVRSTQVGKVELCHWSWKPIRATVDWSFLRVVTVFVCSLIRRSKHVNTWEKEAGGSRGKLKDIQVHNSCRY